MKILIASHTSAGTSEIIAWLTSQPGTRVYDLYRIEYIDSELDGPSPEEFDLIIASGAGRYRATGDSAPVHYDAPQKYALERDIPYVSLYEGNERRPEAEVIEELKRHVPH